jgi:hypothetical protein
MFFIVPSPREKLGSARTRLFRQRCVLTESKNPIPTGQIIFFAHVAVSALFRFNQTVSDHYRCAAEPSIDHLRKNSCGTKKYLTYI